VAPVLEEYRVARRDDLLAGIGDSTRLQLAPAQPRAVPERPQSIAELNEIMSLAGQRPSVLRLTM
jgi:hypothetical protein